LATGYADTYFLLVDPETEQVILQVGDSAGIQEPIAPNCSFNIALSLMGFDAGILIDEENPTWAEFENDDEREVCRQPLNPKSWMAKSCPWYSQSLTKRLGMDRFQGYVDAFEYGNQDLTGNPGLNDGLARAWLSSSLAISCEAQIQFLRKMVSAQLPVSDYALAMTRTILLIEELGNGWNLFGKTGAGYQRQADGTPDPQRRFGWFVGWVEKGDRRFLFALNMRNLTDVPPMTARWQIAKEFLAQTGILTAE
jgi:beta-lactamase class D